MVQIAKDLSGFTGSTKRAGYRSQLMLLVVV